MNIKITSKYVFNSRNSIAIVNSLIQLKFLGTIVNSPILIIFHIWLYDKNVLFLVIIIRFHKEVFILNLIKGVRGLEIRMLVIVKVMTQDSTILIYKFSPKGMIIQKQRWRKDA